ncbi:M10 family metallopeptidase C-terminal domain-containing protein [Prochlorococcus marinus]|uniref:Peptidase metallopeptidase domain-containing protein n=1 Tax=Prochlorococcus marinus (strain MIT 9303) TaxID=59922 RepID=A2CBH4_PROM3|nr:M10 family metallopeptidase C-terminal domain-containing protein [Prochlorococcus marinus]ABM78834.1 Hypothetical protein P9303_20991 [Prochlorococcus marinus str. MIT 9303]
MISILYHLLNPQNLERKSISNRGYAEYLEYESWLDSKTLPWAWNLADHEDHFHKNGRIRFNVSGWNNEQLAIPPDSDGLIDEYRNLAREAFKLFEENLGIDFVETNEEDADIFFIDNHRDGGYWSYTPLEERSLYSEKAYPEHSFINITVDDSLSAKLHGGLFATFIHEIGHSLGLGHDGNYNFDDSNPKASNYENAGPYLNSSQQSSMMSYFRVPSKDALRSWGVEMINPNIANAHFEHTNTPMPIDWLALDNIYKQQGYGISNSFNGDTLYGADTSIPAEVSNVWNQFADFIHHNAFTIVDGSGHDIIDVSFSGFDQTIDLRATDPNSDFLYPSDVNGLKGNLYIAANTEIEEAITGSGNDLLIGNKFNNILDGGSGSDELWGFKGANTLKAGDFDDVTDKFYIKASNMVEQCDFLFQVDSSDRIYIDTSDDGQITYQDHIEDPNGSNYVGVGIFVDAVLEALVINSGLTSDQVNDITKGGDFY